METNIDWVANGQNILHIKTVIEAHCHKLLVPNQHIANHRVFHPCRQKPFCVPLECFPSHSFYPFGELLPTSNGPGGTMNQTVCPKPTRTPKWACQWHGNQSLSHLLCVGTTEKFLLSFLLIGGCGSECRGFWLCTAWENRANKIREAETGRAKREI